MRRLLITTILLILTAAGCAPKRGRMGERGHSGNDGAPGIGIPGAPGSDGYTSLIALVTVGECTTILSGLDTNRDSQLEGGEVMASAQVCNGIDGANGADGAPGQDAVVPDFAPVAVIDPCGAQGLYDEVLLRLANGQLLASFSENANGKNTRFALLPPGSYSTTDGTNCHFSVGPAPTYLVSF